MQCAQVRGPGGGPKDVAPPQIVATTPLNYTLDFSAKEVVIEFDEYVRLNNVSDQLIVSPRLPEDPDVSVKKGHILKIELPDSLMPNTTYTMNFGNSVEDITEGNKASDLNFVFSTGSYLDSLVVYGTLKNAYSMAPEKGMLVMLYDANTDPNPRVDPPLYFTRTNAQGAFQLHNLRNTEYMIFALEDLNFNYLYDLPNERIAFFPANIEAQQADSTAVPTELRMFEEASTEQFIDKFEFGPFGKLFIHTNLPVDSLGFHVDGKRIAQSSILREDFQKKDTVIFWLKDTVDVDGIDLFFFDGHLAMDTIAIDRPPVSKKNRKLRVRPTISGDFGPKDQLILESTRPIAELDTAQMLLVADEDTLPFKLIPQDEVKRRFLVEMERPDARRFSFTMMHGSFEDIYGQRNDSSTYVLGSRDADYYGTIEFKLQHGGSDHQMLLQLETERGELVSQDIITGAFEKQYAHLYPGDHKFRLIHDLNNNGQWDTGNFSDGILAEPVMYYSEKITVRSGWRLELEWVIE